MPVNGSWPADASCVGPGVADADGEELGVSDGLVSVSPWTPLCGVSFSP